MDSVRSLLAGDDEGRQRMRGAGAGAAPAQSEPSPLPIREPLSERPRARAGG